MLAMALAAGTAMAQDEPLRLYSPTGSGPIAIWSAVYKDQTGWTAGIKNESAQIVKSFCLCIQPARDKDGCRALTRCYLHQLGPGEVFRVSEPITVRGHGLPAHRVLLLSLSHVTPLDKIHKLYVDELAGGIADLGRDQVMAAVVADSNGRFELTEDRASADAVITGRAESRDTGQTHSEETKGSTFGIGGGGAHVGGSAAESGGHATISGSAGAIVGGYSHGSVKEADRTEVITREWLILRLVDRDGRTLWAWDGSKPCDQSEPKAKCAVADLVMATNQ